MRSADAISGLGHAEAEAGATLLRAMLPPDLVPLFDASFLRSHLLYDEFVYRLVLKVIRDRVRVLLVAIAVGHLFHTGELRWKRRSRASGDGSKETPP